MRVYDSFVPVEYGRFTGGVVDARLRRFSGENHLKFDYRWNTLKMTQQQVSEGEENSWAQGQPGYSPEWKKRFYSVVGDFAFNDKSGVVLAMSRRESDITRWNMGVDDKGQPQQGQDTYRDRVDNFLGKFSVRASADTTADLTLKYSDRSETLSSYLFRDTHWDNNHGAYGLSGNLDHLFQGGRFTLQAGWDHATRDRQSVGDELEMCIRDSYLVLHALHLPLDTLEPFLDARVLSEERNRVLELIDRRVTCLLYTSRCV